MKTLTARQKEVLQHLVAGHMTKETAKALCVSPKTIEKHRNEINYKLQTTSVLSMTRVALRSGLVKMKDFLASEVGETKEPRIRAVNRKATIGIEAQSVSGMKFF